MRVSIPIALPRELGQSGYARANPLARLAPAAALGLVNVFTLDPVTPVLTLLVVACAVPFLGLSWPNVARGRWHSRQ